MTPLAQAAASAANPPAGRREPPERRTFAKVRRRSAPCGLISYRPISVREMNDRVWALRRFERKVEKAARRKNAAVGHVGLEVYEALCRLAARGAGRLDQISYEGLARLVRRARSAVVAAVARLKAHGWLDWTRQFEETGQKGVRGPQVQQTVNAFRLLVPAEALRRLGIRFGPPPKPDDAAWREEQAEAERKDMAFAVSPTKGVLDRWGQLMAEREGAKGASAGGPGT